MTDRPRLGISDVKPLLVRRIAELVAQLCPNARREGDHWVAPNPRRAEDKGGSFIVWKNGAWKEYDAGDQEKGDIISLIVYTGQASDLAGALKWAKDWLGLTGAETPEIVRLREQAKAAEERENEEERERRASMIRFAMSVWVASGKLEPGTPAWTYLEDARGIPMRRLIDGDGLKCLRAHPALQYSWPPADQTPVQWRARRPRTGTEYLPALVASMSPINGGANLGVHRTYLERDGLSKARVIKAKKMLGVQIGCAIKLWRGESGLSASEAAHKGFSGPVAITEGIENGLSIAAASPELRVWAIGSLAGLASLEWHPCVSEFVIFRDNDWDNPRARQQVEETAERLAQRGSVKLANSPVGKDANDLLNAERH